VNIQHLEYCTACYSLVAGMLNMHVWLLSRAPRGNPASPANMSVPKDETRFKVSSSRPKRFDGRTQLHRLYVTLDGAGVYGAAHLFWKTRLVRQRSAKIPNLHHGFPETAWQARDAQTVLVHSK
jgi:hypothetical protein